MGYVGFGEIDLGYVLYPVFRLFVAP